MKDKKDKLGLYGVMDKVNEVQKFFYKTYPDLTVSIGTDCTRKGNTDTVIVKHRVTISEACSTITEQFDASLEVATIKAILDLI